MIRSGSTRSRFAGFGEALVVSLKHIPLWLSLGLLFLWTALYLMPSFMSTAKLDLGDIGQVYSWLISLVFFTLSFFLIGLIARRFSFDFRAMRIMVPVCLVLFVSALLSNTIGTLALIHRPEIHMMCLILIGVFTPFPYIETIRQFMQSGFKMMLICGAVATLLTNIGFFALLNSPDFVQTAMTAIIPLGLCFCLLTGRGKDELLSAPAPVSSPAPTATPASSLVPTAIPASSPSPITAPASSSTFTSASSPALSPASSPALSPTSSPALPLMSTPTITSTPSSTPAFASAPSTTSTFSSASPPASIPTSTPSLPSSVRIPYKLLITSAIQGAAYGLGRFCLAYSDIFINTSSVFAYLILVVGFVLAALTLVVLVSVFRFDFNLLIYKIGFVLLGVGLLLFTLGPLRHLGVLSFAAGYRFIDLLIFTLVVYLASANNLSLNWTASWPTCVLYIGFAIGYSLPESISSTVNWITAESLITVMAVIVLLLAIFALNERNVPGAWGYVELSDDYAATNPYRAQVISDICQSRGLSVRQREVFEFLAQGKVRKEIAQELCLSEETVKVHIRNIYVKLNIHTKKELLHLIESEEKLLFQ